MRTKLVGILLAVVLVLGLILITSCAQQNSPVNTGNTGPAGQPQQPQTGGNQGGQPQGGSTPATETPPVQTQTPPPSPPSTPSQPAKTYEVTIQGFAFSPFDLKINKGDTVIWTNKDSAPHTVTSDSGNELASDSLSNGQTYSHTFNQAGTFNYHCGVHLSMKARVEVV
jgi:plastocyanin